MMKLDTNGYSTIDEADSGQAALYALSLNESAANAIKVLEKEVSRVAGMLDEE